MFLSWRLRGVLEFQFKNFPSFSRAVHGGWSDWTESPCDAPCGPGKRNRTRTCDNPPPSGGGAECSGPALETVDCNVGPCVGKLLQFLCDLISIIVIIQRFFIYNIYNPTILAVFDCTFETEDNIIQSSLNHLGCYPK